MDDQIKQPFSWLEGHYPDLAAWIREMTSFLPAEDVCEIRSCGNRVWVYFFSERNVYHLAASKSDDYLGLTFHTRDSGAGNDLTDGPYEKSTWDEIVRDMLSCELISLKRRDDPNHED